MISPKLAKLISYLPDNMVRKISNKILKGYIDEYANIRIEGLENINNIEKPILFISNHLSNADALIIDNVLKEQDITFVAGIKLSNNPLTNLGLKITKTITIKPNTADKEAISNIIKTLKDGNNVLIFPEGTRSRNASLIEGKKGVVLIQKLSKARVIPIGITGTQKLLPINNKDMGLEKFNYSDININIGKPLDNIPLREKGEKKHDYEDKVLTHFMESIAKLLPKEYQGVYKIN